MRRLDLALLVYDLDVTGGMERQARALAERLAERGARVRIVTSFWTDGVLPRWPRGRRAFERHGRLSIARVALPRGWGYLPGLSFYELAAAALLAPRPPDVLYAIQWTGGVHAVRLGRLLDRRVAVKLACGGVHGDMTAIRRAEDATSLETLRRADRVVCLSKEIEAEALASGFRPEQLASIPNGVDLARFEQAEPARLLGLEQAERVLFVGAFRAQKHLPSLLRAIALLASKRPRLHLVLAGEGPEENALRVLSRELGLESRVHFLGRRSDVPALLKQAHVFVLPSESEGLSNALLEALAAGAPAVATDIEGNRTLVSHEREALLFPLDDEAALARAIERLLDDRALAEQLTRAGHERARELSLDEIARRYEQALGALARPRPAPWEIARRYLTAFENPGVSGFVAQAVRYVSRRLGRGSSHAR